MKKMFALVLCLIVFFANGNVMAENTYLQNGNVYKCITDNGEVWEYELHKNGDLTLNNQILQENVTEFGYGVNCIISVVNDDEVYKTRIGDFKPLYIASGYRYFIWDGKGFIKYFRNSEKLYQVGSSTSTPSNWAEEEIEESISSGIYTMPAMENYQANITREQFCELVTLTYEKLSGKNPKTGDTKFEDTDNIDVLKAADLGIVEGYGNGKFCPDEWITREQICTMIVRMLKRSIKNIDTDYNNNAFVDIDEISDWAIPSVNFAYDKGIMKGVETLKIAPLNNTTCEEALLLMYRVYCKYSNSKNNDIQSSNTTKSGISETDFLDMKDLDNEIENVVSDYTIYDDIIPEYNIQDVIDIVNEFAENKLESGEIEDYYTDEYSVWMKLNSGLEYVYTPNVEGLDLGSEELSVITCQPFNTDYGEKDKSFKTNGEKATDGIARTMQTNFKNIVFEHNYDDYEVTLDVIKNFTDNQIILWHGHGGYNKMKHSYIYVGSVCDEYLLWTDLNYYRDHIEYEKDYLAGRIVFSSSQMFLHPLRIFPSILGIQIIVFDESVYPDLYHCM